jgi:hypothetical protein
MNVGLLVIISCGRAKIWDKQPNLGAVQAKDAYSSPVFRAGRRYAEHFAEKWVILSAKYGFLEADQLIEPYNLSFYQPEAVQKNTLQGQVHVLGLNRFPTVGVVGSEIYWRNARGAFEGTGVSLNHVNSGVGFPPMLQTLIRTLIRDETPFRTEP